MLRKLRDVFIGLGIVGGFLWLFAVWGPPYWVWFLASLALLVAIWELTLRLTTGKTLSQHFWVWNQQHPRTKWILGGLLLLLCTFIIIHLMWK